jgi:hypothetical protein
VKEGVNGLTLVPGGPRHLINALVWAVGAAHAPVPMVAVH